MLVEFGRKISLFKFSDGAREQGFKFCRFLREALPRGVSFKILMFRFFLRHVFAIKFYFTLFAGRRFSVRLKF